MIIEKNVGFVRDPIHNYIAYTISKNKNEIAEKDIIDNFSFQRLRRIFQLQTAWMVYPGAMHTRFQHSLGVMKLAGDFARILYRRYKELQPQSQLPEEEYIVELFRIVGLLHDIGHGPFGHTLDELYTYKFFQKTHEDIGQKIIKEKLGELIPRIKRSPWGEFETKLNEEQIINFIKPSKPFNKPWESNFSKIIYGLYSVDKLDYLLRDSYFCGTPEFGVIDITRLFNSSYITDDGLVLDKTSVPVLKAFLWARFFMYENVYLHKTVRAIDLSFSELLSSALELMDIGNPYDNLDRFLSLDDFSLSSEILSWRNQKNKKKREIGKKWADIFEKRIIKWKLAYQKEMLLKESPALLCDFNTMQNRIHSALRSKLKQNIEFIIDLPYLDIRPENPFAQISSSENILIYDPVTKRVDNEALLNLFESIPTKLVMVRVFSHRENVEKVNKICHETFNETNFNLQTTSY